MVLISISSAAAIFRSLPGSRRSPNSSTSGLYSSTLHRHVDLDLAPGCTSDLMHRLRDWTVWTSNSCLVSWCTALITSNDLRHESQANSTQKLMFSLWANLSCVVKSQKPSASVQNGTSSERSNNSSSAGSGPEVRNVTHVLLTAHIGK